MKFDTDANQMRRSGAVKTASDGSVEVDADMLGAFFMHIRGDEMLKVPGLIRARVREGEWDVSMVIRLVEGDTLPEIDEITVRRRPNGAPIGADVMRLLHLGDAKDRAIRLASTRYVRSGPDTWTLDPRELTTAHRGIVTRRRGRTVDDTAIALAAEAFRQAKSDGRRDHLLAVAKACNVSRSTADRYIRRAIASGLIEEV